MNFNRKSLILTILGSIVVLTVSLISFFNKPVQLGVYKNNIKISGINGLNLSMEDITEVNLKEALPQEVGKVNMKKSGDISVGNFKPNDSEKVKIFTYSDEGPFICITTKNNDEKYVIINYKDRKHTEDLYKIISNGVKK